MAGKDEFYARADYTYGSKPRLTGVVNPNDPAYQPRNIPAPAYELVSARIGYRFDDLDLSLFANNLFNYHKAQGVTYVSRSPYYTESYLQPRTVGLMASYQF